MVTHNGQCTHSTACSEGSIVYSSLRTKVLSWIAPQTIRGAPMHRRVLIWLLGGIATLPVAVAAQQPPERRREVDVVVQNMPAQSRQKSLNADYRPRRCGDTHIPSHEKVMEKAASATMTRTKDSTTACVVCRPTLEALRSTSKP